MPVPHLLTRAREVYASRPDLLRLIDASVVAEYDLTPPEVKVFAAALLNHRDGLTATLCLVYENGLTPERAGYALRSLQSKGLLAVDGDTLRFLAATALRVESTEEATVAPELPPEPMVVFRPMRERVVAMARARSTPAAGLGDVFALLYGVGEPRKNSGSFYGVLGKMANAIGADAAALLLLEVCHQPYYGDPLREILSLALGRAKGFRPDDAPAVEEQKRERLQADRASWLARLERWTEEGGEAHALAGITQAEELTKAGAYSSPLSPEQAEADRRQVKKDYARQRAERGIVR